MISWTAIPTGVPPRQIAMIMVGWLGVIELAAAGVVPGGSERNLTSARRFTRFIEIDETHLGVVVADSSAKGTTGAMIMSQVRSLVRAFGPDGRDHLVHALVLDGLEFLLRQVEREHGLGAPRDGFHDMQHDDAGVAQARQAHGLAKDRAHVLTQVGCIENGLDLGISCHASHLAALCIAVIICQSFMRQPRTS